MSADKYVEFADFTVSGSADCNSDFLKKLLIDNDPQVKVIYTGGTYSGKYIIKTAYRDTEALANLCSRIKRIASHARPFNWIKEYIING